MANPVIYVCPMHPEVRQEFPGKCRKCGGMQLVPQGELKPDAPVESVGFLATYRPLLTIVGLILLPVITLALRDASAGAFVWQDAMMHFMAGFFLVFSGLKLLDVPGFATGYATYDLLASRVKAYGYVYPFLELALGLAYLARFELWTVNVITLVLMVFSGIGVTLSILQKKKFTCACLGTFIKVPLTKVTIVEDFGMAAMALAMLLTM